MPEHRVRANVWRLKERLQPYGLDGRLALCPLGTGPAPPTAALGCLDLEALAADLLLNFRYSLHADVVKQFRRSALMDIDPGLLQLWISGGHMIVAPHDVYFSTGETVGQAGALFPSAGLRWVYTPPCVALDWWPPRPADRAAPFTTVSHWTMNAWVVHNGQLFWNAKCEGFRPFLDLPRHTERRLELALCLAPEEAEQKRALEARGWRVRDAQAVASTPWDYQEYIQRSFGEFSCVKPSCVRLQNAWVSDRTLCYLASGKPAVVQHTGPSRFLPDGAGLFRFRDIGDAARALETVAGDYERQCRLARALAEEHFNATKVVAGVLERGLD